jgi:retron-type reverse transcriptase
MSLTTPDKIRNLQRKLYYKAKAEPAFRFYLLYDKICREDILVHAYRLARFNAGAPGVDGMTFARIEEQGLEAWLAGLRAELVSKTYRPDPVRRVMIPKANGGERPLGIPTIRDRVIQTAAKIVIEPIFEADFEDNAYGYRPARGAVDAVKEVHRHLCRGYADVVDADLSKYFDTIPHSELIKSVARRVVDRNVLRLIKMWLRAPIEERDADGTRRMSGGKGKHARHAARRRRKSTAGQHLHEPVPEALAFDWLRRHVPGSRCLLCRRLRYPQPRSCGGGIGVDEGGDDQARVDDQRGENFVEKRPTGTLRLPRLLVRRALV